MLDGKSEHEKEEIMRQCQIFYFNRYAEEGKSLAGNDAGLPSGSLDNL
jgi:hypothetical protein